MMKGLKRLLKSQKMRRNKEIIYRIKKIRWPYGYLLFFILSCNSEAHFNPIVITTSDSVKETNRVQRAEIAIDAVSKLIQNGDLVTRTGNDFTSESLRSLNQRNKTYSHCGIASIEHDSLFIYHALGGDFNPDQKLLREPFTTFAEPYSNKGMGLFRFDVPESVLQQLLKIVHDYYLQGIMFDMAFDLSTDDRMYCAEFVSKSYHKAAGKTLIFPTSKIGKFRFVGVDDIFLHPLCKKISSIQYK